MALFRKNPSSPGDGQPPKETLDSLRLREQMVSRRESDAMRRERAILERQIELDRRTRELAKREAEQVRTEDRLQRKVQELKGRFGDLGLSQSGEQALPASVLAAIGRPGEGGPGAAPQVSAPAASPSDSGIGVRWEAAGGSPDARLAELRKREEKVAAEQARLEEWAAELDRQSADLAVREARLAVSNHLNPPAAAPAPVPVPAAPSAPTAAPAPAAPGGFPLPKGFEFNFGAGFGGGGASSARGAAEPASADANRRIAELERQLLDARKREAELTAMVGHGGPSPEAARQEIELAARAASLNGRAAELDRQTADLKEREHKLIGQITAHAVRQAELERQAGDLTKLQANLQQTQEMLDARQFELDKREVELRQLQSDLRSQQTRLDQRRPDTSSSSLLTSSSLQQETLPDYVSDMSVLKADQVRLQERFLSGGSGTHVAEEFETNVLF